MIFDCFMEDLPFEPYVPLNSLRYKCLSQLASMMRQSESSTSEAASINKDSIPLSSHFQSKSGLELPTSVVQLIVDHVTLERIPIRHQALCALLSYGGCFSLDLSILAINEEEIGQIFGILASNCDNLFKLNLGSRVWMPLQSFASIKLRYLRLTIASLTDLISVFSAFPNLIGLSLYWRYKDPVSATQQIDNFLKELRKPLYNQVRHSLQEFDLGFRCEENGSDTTEFNVLIQIKLASYFPNLTRLHNCNLTDDLCVGKNFINLTFTELKNAFAIFAQLKGFKTYSDLRFDITVLAPNLQELYIGGFSRNIENLTYLKSLTISGRFERIVLILKQIGHNLESLNVQRSDSVSVQVIAQYCQNLKHLHIDDSKFDCIKSSIVRFDPVMYKKDSENLDRPFCHLKTLKLVFCRDNNVFYYILKHAVNIESIKLSECMITKEKLTKLFEFNPMNNLRCLIIYDMYFPLSMFEYRFNLFDKLCYVDHDVYNI